MAFTGKIERITQLRWREGGGSWTTIPNAFAVLLKLGRFSRFAGMGSGQVPGAPRIIGEILSESIDEHIEMMDNTTVSGAESTDADIEITFVTTGNVSDVMLISEVIFVGTGQLQIGNKGGTTDKSQRSPVKTPFEIRMDDNETPSDFITES